MSRFRLVPVGSVPVPTRPSLRTLVGIDPKRATGTKIIAQQESHQSSPNIAAEHCQLNPNNAAEHSVCPQITDSPSEEAATVRSNSPIHTECLIELKSTDQGLGDELDNHIQQEEWLESSPGFDVLVNDRSEALDYEDEALHLLHHDMEDRECNGQSLVYDYKEDIEYDPAYPDIGVSFEREMSDYYDHLEEDVRNTNLTTPFPVKESVLDRIERRKRKLLQTELAGMDLRDYLKKRGMAESQYTKYFSGTPHSSRLIGKIAEETSTGIRGNLRGGLASKVEISVESLIETENCSNSICQHGKRRRPRINRSRLQTKERKQVKQQILSEISGKTASRKRRYSQVSTMFTAPKTLAKIKEEKKKALGVAEISLTEEGHQAVMHK
ncbi:hypothetical protein ACH5RR_004297 [Cinchona calisaya]|uniref:Protein LTV1 homolog n=1 Tax=Cinchona calisaya TaxID=153742 RepID=A0ABD3AXM2_9GENT